MCIYIIYLFLYINIYIFICILCPAGKGSTPYDKALHEEATFDVTTAESEESEESGSEGEEDVDEETEEWQEEEEERLRQEKQEREKEEARPKKAKKLKATEVVDIVTTEGMYRSAYDKPVRTGFRRTKVLYCVCCDSKCALLCRHTRRGRPRRGCADGRKTEKSTEEEDANSAFDLHRCVQLTDPKVLCYCTVFAV